MRMYKGFTYPKIFGNRLVWKLWKKYLCPKHIHLLDEVWSDSEWYLSCDACDIEIHISKVDETYC